MRFVRLIVGLVALQLAALVSPIAALAQDKPAVFESHILKTLPSSTTLDVNPSVSGAASLNVPCAAGVAPSSPADGDVWCTPAGLYMRVGSTTVGPFGATTPPGGSSGQVQWNNGGVFAGFTVSGDATLNTSTGALTLAASGVTAGACGDSTHFCVPTFDAKGRATGTANYAVSASAGGSSGQAQCNSSGTLAGIAATDAQLLIAQASGCPLGKTMSGDATLADTGALSFVLSQAHSWTGAQDDSAGGSITPRATPSTTEKGYLGAPIDEQDGTYTLVMADAGEMVRHSSASNHTYTIPPHSSVAYPVGTLIPIRNAVTGGTLTLAPGSGVSLYQAGATTSGSIALQPGAFVTIAQEASDTWVATGIQASTCTLVQSITTSGSAASETISSIPSGSSNLRLTIVGRTNNTGGALGDAVLAQLNGDTGSNYGSEDYYAFSTSTASNSNEEISSSTSAKIGEIATGLSSNTFEGVSVATIGLYAGTTFGKSWAFTSFMPVGIAASKKLPMFGGGSWNSTAAITSLKVFVTGGGVNFVDGTLIVLERCN